MSADLKCPARRRVVGCGHDLTWGVLEDPRELHAVREAWADLLRPGQYFVSPSWVLRWLAWRGDAVRPSVLVARDGHGTLRGLLPLARTQDDILIPCGCDDGAVGFDVVAPSHDTGRIARGAVAYLAGLGWRRIRLPGLLAGGALHGALQAAPPGRMLSRVSTYCPYLATTDDWTTYLASLSKHQRHELRRKLRRALEVPGTRVRWVRHPGEAAAAVRILFDLHARRFAGTGRRSVFQGSELLAFHTALAEELAARDELILGVLEHAGRAVGAVYGFRCKGRSGLFQSGFDPDTDLPAAGEVLRILLLRAHAQDPAQRELDFLDGCYPWKLRLASGVRRQFDLEIRPRTAIGLLAHAAHAVGRRLRRALVRGVRGDPCPGLCGGPINGAHCRRAGCPDADRYHPDD